MITERDRQYCATVAFCEADSGTAQDRRAVVWTIFNRLALNPARYGTTPMEVAVMRMQYSEFNGDPADNRNLRRAARVPETNALWQDSLAAFDAVNAGTYPDPTGGATHYYDHSLDNNPPAWAAAPAVVTLITDKFTFLKNVP